MRDWGGVGVRGDFEVVCTPHAQYVTGYQPLLAALTSMDVLLKIFLFLGVNFKFIPNLEKSEIH